MTGSGGPTSDIDTPIGLGIIPIVMYHHINDSDDWFATSEAALGEIGAHIRTPPTSPGCRPRRSGPRSPATSIGSG